jgi:hypothetical protein
MTISSQPKFYPPRPAAIEQLGISESLLMDLMLRRLALQGTSTCST